MDLVLFYIRKYFPQRTIIHPYLYSNMRPEFYCYTVEATFVLFW